MSSLALWQDVEYGGYTADLAVWRRLAEAHPGQVLELGSGNGRLALHLAHRGHAVWGVDADADLVSQLTARASSEGLAGVRAIHADVVSMELDCAFGLVVAPMQLMQLLGGRARRGEALKRVASCLLAGGAFAAAVFDAGTIGAGAATSLPDVRELEGWIYSSFPEAVEVRDGRLDIRRIRQTVSPEGVLAEEDHTESLDLLNADVLEGEGLTAGLRPAGRVAIPAQDGYLGSTVVIMEPS
jgi:SAM-dependent methyltransferase